PWYLRMLRDQTAVAERMARLLGTSKYVTGLLLHAPEAVAMLGSDAELEVRPKEALAAEAAATVQRYEPDAETAVTALRALRRRELFRLSVASLVGRIDVEQ